MSLPDSFICRSSGSHFYVYGNEKAIFSVIVPIVDEIHLLSQGELSLNVGYYYLSSAEDDMNAACDSARLGVEEESVFLKEIRKEKPDGEKE
jgi:hypothetical protein